MNKNKMANCYIILWLLCKGKKIRTTKKKDGKKPQQLHLSNGHFSESKLRTPMSRKQSSRSGHI